MGYECSGDGSVTIELAREKAAVAAFRAHPEFGAAAANAKDLGVILSEALGLDVVEYSANDGAADGERLYQTYYSGRWDGTFLAMIRVLAEHGATADFRFTGGDDAIWKIVAEDGTARELSAVTFFPGDIDPNAPCVAVSRRDAQTILALLTGDHVDGLDEVVKKLTDALN